MSQCRHFGLGPLDSLLERLGGSVDGVESQQLRVTFQDVKLTGGSTEPKA